MNMCVANAYVKGSTMKWRHTTEIPFINQLILVVVNDALIPDIFVYQPNVAYNNGAKIEWFEVQAWASFSDIGHPEWLHEQMQNRIGQATESVLMAREYRKRIGADLFGKVSDPDDIEEGRA